MNNIKLSLAAAALFVGLGTVGASAMPMTNLSGVDVGAKTDQVRMVCDQWGRCSSRSSYNSYGSYGYNSPRYNRSYNSSRYYGGHRAKSRYRQY